MNEITLHDIKDGLDRDEFRMHYQPKVSLHTGMVCGAEALIRWYHGANVILPSAFIPLAERTGFVSVLTERVFELLARDMPLLMERNPALIVAVNVSPHDFQKNRIVRYLESLEKKGTIAPSSLKLEITEETATTASGELVSVMSALTEYGVTFSLDDFGTGYSSMDVLSRLPFSEIKLDQSLVRQMSVNPKAKSIVAATIRMAHRLNMHTVGEGIETEASFEEMAVAGCENAQGYWISRPLGLADFLEFLVLDQKWPANVSGLLYQAQMDHIQWRHDLVDVYYRLRDCSSESKRQLTNNFPHSISDPHRCKLGGWYDGPGRMYAGMKQYVDLKVPHKRFHEVGARLLVHAQAGDLASCRELLREFSSLSTDILNCLHELEEVVQHSEVTNGKIRAAGGAT
ncbi:MAG: EAL domain-containing protein [Alphaproteobacteria bacterium]